MARSTPWGSAQHVTTHLRGFATVSTASHGGMMVSRKAAEKYLSEAARKRALMHGGYYCYEEDDMINIVLFDVQQSLRSEILKDFSGLANLTAEEADKKLIHLLSSYNYQYLLDVGVEPDAVEMKHAKLREQYGANYAAKDPNTVGAAWGDWDTLVDGVIKVITADDKYHYVTKASHDAMNADPELAISRPLSALELVDPETLPVMADRLEDYVLKMSQPYVEQIESDHEDAVKEAEGNHYGPRKRFNGTLSSVNGAFLRYFMNQENKSYSEAESIFVERLTAVRSKLHVELQGVDMFEKFCPDAMAV